jgi:pimeloyl-ACP methyl ester carboxylesterase
MIAPMPHATLPSGIELEYEAFGPSSAPPLLLVMGLGAQMVLWDDALCADLVDRGFHVVRFDNRDIGKSSILDSAGVPDVFAAMTAAMAGQRVEAPYTLDDMADDAVGLLDVLGIARAHVVGASMGGMIAQTVALRHPDRLLTLTSIMSTTGDPRLPQATPEAMGALLAPPVFGREENVERAVRIWKVIGSPGFPFDEAWIRHIAGVCHDRGFHPTGVTRQLCAILASGDRTPRLGEVRTPTLAIHGDADPLVRLEAGRATVDAIPGAELVVIKGMGHDLPRGAWSEMTAAIARHATRAGAVGLRV